MSKFNIGDKVKTYIGVGTVIAFDENVFPPYTVEYENFDNGHDGNHESGEDGEIHNRYWHSEQNMHSYIEKGR